MKQRKPAEVTRSERKKLHPLQMRRLRLHLRQVKHQRKGASFVKVSNRKRHDSQEEANSSLLPRKEHLLLKYQIGSGMIAGRERIVLSCQETYLDLFTLLNNAHLKEALSLVHGETPASLMHMMRQWLYWRGG